MSLHRKHKEDRKFMPSQLDKKLIVVWLLTSLCTFTDAQTLKDHLSKGDKYYQKKDYENAIKSYLDALQFDANDATTNFKLGVSYLHNENKTNAVVYLEKAYNTKPEAGPDIDYHLGMAYQHNHQYAKASKHFAAFKIKNKKLSEIADHKIIECSIGDSLMRLPANVEIHSFGPGINSSLAEFSPLVSGDGKTLIFTSNRSSDDYKIKSGTNFEDIYIAHKNGDQWSQPEKISPNINIKFNDAAASLSHDGKTLFLYYEEGQGDIYTSTFENGGWTKPVPLNRFINHPLFWETAACVSADGKNLYFSSNRPGGKGGLDIYVCELDKKGQWGRPSNLGSTINTNRDEDSPFLHADGVTLYFSSNGHPTLGSNDIFQSEWKEGRWTKPENLGYPINSSEYDGFFTLSDDKKTGYYSAHREEGPGNTDIYSISFLGPKKDGDVVILASAETQPKNYTERKGLKPAAPEPEVQEPVVSKSGDLADPMVQPEKKIETKLKGRVIDIVSAGPLSATISLVDNKINRTIAKIISDDSGDFELIIPYGGNYGVRTEKNGYLFNSINFDLPPFEKYQEVDTHILMVKAEVGSIIVLKNIFFDVGKSDFKGESLGELENVRDLIRQNSHLRVQINGHTDNKGNAATNRALSLKRAESVIHYLIKQGIEPKRLAAKGYGSERPLVSNDDEEEGRQINRRTEVEIIESDGNR